MFYAKLNQSKLQYRKEILRCIFACILIYLVCFNLLYKNNFANAKTTSATFLASVTIPSYCEIAVNKPIFYNSDNFKVQLLSDIKLFCNDSTNPSIKILSNNMQQIFKSNLLVNLKKNNKEFIEFADASLLMSAGSKLLIKNDSGDNNFNYTPIKIDDLSIDDANFLNNVTPYAPMVNNLTLVLEVNY